MSLVTCSHRTGPRSYRTLAGDPLCGDCTRRYLGGWPWCTGCGAPDWGEVHYGPRQRNQVADLDGWRWCHRCWPVRARELAARRQGRAGRLYSLPRAGAQRPAPQARRRARGPAG